MTDMRLSTDRAPLRNTGDVLHRAVGWPLALWLGASAVAVIGLVMGLQAALNGAPWPASTLSTFGLLLWLCLLPQPWLAFGALQAERAVWIGRVAPRQALSRALAAWRSTVAIGVALSLLPLLLLGVMSMSPHAAAMWALFTGGLILGTVALGTLASAAWRGLVHGVWVLPGVCALAASPVVWTTLPETQAWPSAEGWRAVVWATLAASPLLAWAVLRPTLRANGVARARPAAAPGGTHSLKARWQRLAHEWGGRLRALDGTSAAGILGALGGQVPQQVISRDPEGLLFMPWGSAFTPLGGYRWLLLTLIALVLLRSPSLHWRHLLAPGATLRTRLGWEVTLHTWWMLVLLLTALLGLVALITVWWADDGAQLWLAAPSVMARYVPLLLLDLALASALASLLRGWAGSLGRSLWALAGLLVLGGLLHLALWLATGQPEPVLMHRDQGYVVLVMLLLLALLGLNVRAWQQVDLGALVRASRSKGPASGPGAA